jgi:hypothetical protein
MPRDGSKIYSYPVGSEGIPDTTIESGKYNVLIADVEQDLNLPRPIIAGGTAANNAVDAMINLSGEIAKQLVTNYDAHIFQSGSFHSAITATGAPVEAHAFSGICYKVDDNNMVLEARDGTDTFVPGRPFIREKKAGVWSAWVTDNYITKFGPSTMEGPLTIDPAGPGDATIILNSDVANSNLIFGDKAGKHRWVVVLGNTVAEADPQTGSDFSIYSYKNDGTFLENPLSIVRSTGLAYVKGVPTEANGIANKGYVDAREAAEVARANAAYQAKNAQLFAGIPVTHFNTEGYTTSAADEQKMLCMTAGTPITITINGAAHAVGTVISFFAHGNWFAINNTETMMWRTPAGVPTTGNRSLQQYGVCTAHKWTTGNWVISGNGVT